MNTLTIYAHEQYLNVMYNDGDEYDFPKSDEWRIDMVYIDIENGIEYHIVGNLYRAILDITNARKLGTTIEIF